MSDMQSTSYVMGIDPGKAKCGIAVISPQGECMTRLIVPKADLEQQVLHLATQYPLQVVVVGDRTGSRETYQLLKRLLREHGETTNVSLQVVPEHYSSVEARRRYLLEHRKGWRRLVPLGLQTPNTPFDDYTAEVIAQRYLESRPTKHDPPPN